MFRMKVNENRNSICEECKCEWKNTKEMYDVQIFGQKHTVCKECLEDIMLKILRMDVKYSAKLKSQADLKRAENSRKKTFKKEALECVAKQKKNRK